MKKKAKDNPAASMLIAKKKLIKRLNEDIAQIRYDATQRVAKVEGRIRIAQALITALEKGTLKF